MILFFLLMPLLNLAQQKDLTDTTEFRYGLPISNDDTTERVKTDEDQYNQWVPIDAQKIPDALKNTLNKKEIYNGWERGQLYYDKRIRQYVVRIREAKSIRTYSFSREGAVISFAEEDIVPKDTLR